MFSGRDRHLHQQQRCRWFGATARDNQIVQEEGMADCLFDQLLQETKRYSSEKRGSARVEQKSDNHVTVLFLRVQLLLLHPLSDRLKGLKSGFNQLNVNRKIFEFAPSSGTECVTSFCNIYLCV
jgi:hypothetical protein